MKDMKKPNIRFAGFSDAWEQRKLGDLATSFEYGLNASAKSFDGTHKYIRITDIDDSSRKFNSQSLTSPDIDLSSADNHKLKNGDILFARTGASVGKSYIYADSDGLVYYAGFLIRARIKSGVDSNFVFQHTLTSSYENFIRVTSQRSGQPGVNAKEYSTFEISVPSYEEQRKIGSFFKQLDDTITLHQRKLDKLKLLKQGYLQQLFPQNDEKVPRVRFANFKNKWEQRKLGSLATIVRGASPRPIQDPKWFDNESDIGWLRITDVTEQDGKIYHLEQHISKLGQAKTRVLIEPHLLLSIAATVGKPVVNYVKTGVHDGFLIFLSPTFEREFMFQWLEMFRPKWQKYGQPGSQVNLNSELVRNQEIVLPNHKEQQKIGAFLKQIDKAIILHKSKLDKLISLKKVLLQKMFI